MRDGRQEVTGREAGRRGFRMSARRGRRMGNENFQRAASGDFTLHGEEAEMEMRYVLIRILKHRQKQCPLRDIHS